MKTRLTKLPHWWNFLLLGRLELKEDNIESLLSTACLLQLSQVVEACCKFLMKQLHPSNCLGIRSFADAQGCTDLHKVAHNYTMVCIFWKSKSSSPHFLPSKAYLHVAGFMWFWGSSSWCGTELGKGNLRNVSWWRISWQVCRCRSGVSSTFHCSRGWTSDPSRSHWWKLLTVVVVLWYSVRRKDEWEASYFRGLWLHAGLATT